MAQPLSIPELTSRPAVSYAEIRNSLRKGDRVFCSGYYLFSKVIRKVTGSRWRYVGVVHRDDFLKRNFTLESETTIGVQLAFLSKYLRDSHGRRKPYRGGLFVARFEPEGSLAAQQQGISFGMNPLTKSYDNREILRIGLRILLGVGRKIRDRKYICSEFVSEAFRKAGVEFFYRHGSISPDDLCQDTRVQVRFRIL